MEHKPRPKTIDKNDPRPPAPPLPPTDGAAKPNMICPIMTAGNVSPNPGTMGRPYQVEVKCARERCGIWNPTYNRCGFLKE